MTTHYHTLSHISPGNTPGRTARAGQEAPFVWASRPGGPGSHALRYRSIRECKMPHRDSTLIVQRDSAKH
jgi:hypothetical protein